MTKRTILSHFIKFSILAIASISTAYAAKGNFNCPQPSEIKSTDFTSPSIWVAPPVPHSEDGVPGVGLGGKTPLELIGVEEAKVSNKPGWVCVYKSEGGVSTHEYQQYIKNIIGNTSYLRKYIDKMNQYFDEAEPYLKKYPRYTPVGFIGYQASDENNLNKKKK